MDPDQHGNARVTILPPSLRFQSSIHSTSSKNSYNSNCSNNSNNSNNSNSGNSSNNSNSSNGNTSNDNSRNSKAQEGICLGYASSKGCYRYLAFSAGFQMI